MGSATPTLPFASHESPVNVLVVSANKALRSNLISTLQSPDWNLQEASSGADAFEKVEQGSSEVLLLDPALPDLDAGEFKSLLRMQFPYVQILTVNPHSGQPFGASPTPSPLTAKVVERLERIRPFSASLSSGDSADDEDRDPDLRLPGVVGTSEVMRRVCRVTQLVARRDTTVLITGASGTGKEVIARAIHVLSPRRSSPLVVINCAAIPEPLLEAELFGYVKGAFTGAVQSRIGRIHAAQGGTLFLDEIGDMPLGLQSKLLRFLEQGEVQRLGSSDVFQVDVRVVAATNANLRGLMQEQKFREDLYFRLAVFPIDLPPLKERLDDIPALADVFLARYCGGRVTLAADAHTVFQQHHWPGNVRELRNAIERASILVGDGRQITSEHIVL